MNRLAVLAAVLLVVGFVPLPHERALIVVGSKKFTESVILGEILQQAITAEGTSAGHLRELGGTRMLFDGLRGGELAAYVEYTGTLRKEIYADENLETDEALRSRLAEQGIAMSEPLGFANPYAIVVTQETADQFQLRTISDLARRPELLLGFGNEFLDRGDGWPALRQAYSLPHENVSGMDHDLAYRQLIAGSIDVMDAYATDAEVDRYNLVVLEDDRGHFPRYDSIALYSEKLAQRDPSLRQAIQKLEGQINTPAMAAMNAQVVVDGVSETAAAAEFLNEQLGIASDGAVEPQSRAAAIWQRTVEHADLVRRSLIPAILAAIPLGVLAAKQPRLGQGILAATGVIQTVPSLALLALLMAATIRMGLPTLQTGSATAVIALFLYSLLPIVRNTYEGLRGIARPYREAAESLGLSWPYQLTRVELPLASPMILAGVKTAAVLNIGFASLGALIGAGGYGQPILTGIRLNNMVTILEGALPAAAMAIAAQLLFELAERVFVPAGLRQQTREE